MISYTNVIRALGKGTSNLSIISSASLALSCLFYIYLLASYFKISIHILQDRVVYDTFFSDIYITNRYVDHIIVIFGILLWLILSLKGKTRLTISAIYGAFFTIAILANIEVIIDILAVISVPIVVSLLIYNNATSKSIVNLGRQSLFINYLTIIGIAVGIISIIISSELILFSTQLSDILSIRDYAYDLFVLISSFSPILMVLLILCFPVKLMINEMMRTTSKGKKGSSKSNSILSHAFMGLGTRIALIMVFMLLSIIMAVIPHQPTINKDNQKVGVDTDSYANGWVKGLVSSNNFQGFLRQAFIVQNQGDRPLALIFLFATIKIVNADPSYTIDYVVPLILGPALVLVVYFLTQELMSNNIVSLLASFLTAISFHTLIGIYAGYYANWFALIIGYLSFVFLIRFLKKPHKFTLAVYSSLLLLLLFSHVYTWTVLTLFTGIFLIVMLIFNYYPRKRIILLLLIVLSSVAVDVAKFSITSSSGGSGGLARDVQIANTGVGLKQFSQRWSNLVATMQVYFGAQYSNCIILGLSLYWLFKSNLREVHDIFIIIFLSIGLIPLFFGDWVVQARVLYDIPFQIPAAVALTFVKKQAVNGNLFLLFVCIFIIAMSVRTVSNFYFVSPS
jgi:hypothetical protein